jgi:hypothetical protein
MGEMDQGGTPNPDSAGTSNGTPAGTSAGSQNTDTSGGGDAMVPSWRLREVSEKAKGFETQLTDVQSENQALREQLETLQSSSPGGAGGMPDVPPEEMTPEQKADWIVRRGVEKYGPQIVDRVLESSLKKLVKRDLQVDSLKDVGTVVNSMRQQLNSTVVDQYKGACKQFGFDPDNEELKNFVVGYIQRTNKTPEQTLAMMRQLSGTKAAEEPSADMLTSNINGATSVEDILPKTFAEANALAKEGKAIAQKSALEILNHFQEERAKR